MLQQILEQMYIEPELLEELSEDQKQMLYCKMRQEQVRRWKVHEAKMDEEEKKNNKKPANTGKKSVDFLKGRDGCEWVWVMGDHANDKSIEEILEDETHVEAQKLAEAEAQVQREKEEAELHRQMEEEKQRIIKENKERELKMEEERQRIIKEKEERELRMEEERQRAIKEKKEQELRMEEEKKRAIKEKEERELRLKKEQEQAERNKSIREAQLLLERMDLEKKKREEEEKKRLAEIEAEEKRARRRSREMAESMKEKRSSEIFSTLQRKRMDMAKLAEESSAEVETNWKEQELKAKEAESQLRENARKARVDYNESLRRSFTVLQAAQGLAGSPKPPLPPKKHLMVTSAPGMTNKKPRPLRPKNREMIVSWFRKEEGPKKSGLDPDTGKPAEWFHGIINRKESEEILEGKESGAFIVRVSERVWGYTLSYKEVSRLKHFLIDASDLGYQFFGADQTMHASLADLVKFHKETPITLSGQEKLTIPCGQITDPPNYADLFVKKSGENATS